MNKINMRASLPWQVILDEEGLKPNKVYDESDLKAPINMRLIKRKIIDMRKLTCFLTLVFIINLYCHAQPTSKEVFSVLNNNHCTPNIKVTSYKGVKQTVSKKLPISGNDAELEFLGNKWSCSWQTTKVKNNDNAFDLVVNFKLLKGEAKETGVSIEFAFNQWDTSNYVFMPGAVYNGNRFKSLRIDYPPMLKDPKYQNTDFPPIINDIPRLNIDKGESLIEMETGSMTTPAVGFQSSSTGKGFLILTDQQTRFGNSVIVVEENASRDSAFIRIGAPCVRKKRPTIDRLVESSDSAATWKLGDELTIRLRVYLFNAPVIQSLLNKFAIVRKDIYTSTHIKQTVPYSEAFKVIESKFNTVDWNDNYGYSMELGWCGGGMTTYTLLMNGTEQSRQRAIRNIDLIVEKGLGKSGLSKCCWDGNKFSARTDLVRSNSDVLYFLLKQISLLETQTPGWKCPQKWEDAAQKMAETFVSIWKKNGQFGQFINTGTGEIVTRGSSAGTCVPSALALASVRYKNQEYLDIAKKAARFYYQRDVKAGYTTGGPAEILQAPDSESAYGFMESLAVLYEITGEKEWLDMANDQLRLCATWAVSYDYKFPENSTFAKMDIRASGSVVASAQNKHSAPGICTASGDYLLKLYRATGDPLYIELLQDIAHNITQYVPTKERPIFAKNDNRNTDAGFVSERVQIGDWEGKTGVGEISVMSTWAESSVMMTSVEIPGIYIQTDKKALFTFDNIDAKIVSSDSKGLVIQLTNPTVFTANVRIFAENASQTKIPLGYHSFLKWPEISLKPGETKKYMVSLDGKISIK